MDMAAVQGLAGLRWPGGWSDRWFRRSVLTGRRPETAHAYSTDVNANQVIHEDVTNLNNF